MHFILRSSVIVMFSRTVPAGTGHVASCKPPHCQSSGRFTRLHLTCLALRSYTGGDAWAVFRFQWVQLCKGRLIRAAAAEGALGPIGWKPQLRFPHPTNPTLLVGFTSRGTSGVQCVLYSIVEWISTIMDYHQ